MLAPSMNAKDVDKAKATDAHLRVLITKTYRKLGISSCKLL